MKKLVCLAFCALFLLASCNKETPKNDPKPDGDKNPPVVDQTDNDDENKQDVNKTDDKNGDESKDDEDESQKTPEVKPEPTPADFIKELGATPSSGGEHSADISAFASALINKDTEKFAEFTGGKPEYYDFLTDINITSFAIYAFSFTEDQLADLRDNKDLYFYDTYFVTFDVASSTDERFKVGLNHFFVDMQINALAGNLLNAFMPAEKAMDLIKNGEPGDVYIKKFIKEFLVMCGGSGDTSPNSLVDGKNYPSAFDFSRETHFVTHVMSPAGYQYPYSINEINEFLTNTFDGNAGIKLETDRDFDAWLTGYDATIDETVPVEEQKLFGCSYSHGGSNVMHEITSVETDGTSVVYNVTVFADYTCVAEAKKISFHFDVKEGALPMLTLVNVLDDYGLRAETTSI